MTILSREEVRAIDKWAVEEFAVPSLLLMENAGRGATDVLVSLGVQGPVAIVCGKGNNGGDGLVLARHLAVRGFPAIVHLFAAPEHLSGDAAVQWEIATRFNLPRRVWPMDALDKGELQKAWLDTEWLIDGLYGTGLVGSIRSPLDQVVESMNASGKKVLALDIPSGLDADTGLPLGVTIRAAHTVTFAAWKKGFENAVSRDNTGQVHLVDIGIPIDARILTRTC